MRPSFALLAAALLLASTLAACSEDECKSDSDCPEGRICRVGLCALEAVADTTIPDGATVDCDPAGPGDFVINEILPTSATYTDHEGAVRTGDEFIEIVNVSSKELNMSTLTLTEPGGREIKPGIFCIPPNGAHVVYGNLALNDSGDTVTLLVDGTVDQAHEYGGGTKGVSFTLSDQLNPDGGWTQHDVMWGTPLSPGKCANGNDFPMCEGGAVEVDPDAMDVEEEVIPPCQMPVAEAGEIIVNEILADPGGQDVNGDGNASATGDEFVELVNIGSREVSLASVLVRIGNDEISAGQGCLMPNEARVIFGADASLGLANSGDTVTLVINGNDVQTHTYGSEGGRDVSLTLTTQLDGTSGWSEHDQVSSNNLPWSPGTCANGLPFGRCDEVVEPDVVDGDTTDVINDVPMDTTPPCGPAATVGNLVINEVAANPGGTDFNGDGTPDNSDDEFAEILNSTNKTLDLSGVTLTDTAGGTFTFPAGVCVDAAEAILVFGGGTPFSVTALPPGNAPAQTGLPGINNTAETLTLADATGAVIDTYTQTGATAGESETRSPDYTGAFVKSTNAPSSAGPASPGTCLDGTNFPNCTAPAQ